MKIILSFFFIFSTYVNGTISIAQKEIVNGSLLLIEMEQNETFIPQKIFLNEKVFYFFNHPSKEHYRYSFLAVDYNEPLGDKELFLEYSNAAETVKIEMGTIKVISGKYKKETLLVDVNKVRLSKKNLKRVQKEYEQADIIYSNYRNELLLKDKISHPIKSRITSQFGNERLFNGVRKSYHSGVDFRALNKTKLFAVANGVVVMCKNRFYGGRTIILDHGNGVFSGYFHLYDYRVKEGQNVKKGDFLALSGQSGRVTGPHLHFTMKIQGVTVDPLKAIEELNKLF